MKKYIIIIPVYNDWQSVLKLIDNIDLQINNQNVDIIIINDASTDIVPEPLAAVKSVSVKGAVKVNTFDLPKTK